MSQAGKRCVVIENSPGLWGRMTERLLHGRQFDFEVVHGETLDDRDVAALIDPSTFAIVLPLSLPRFKSLRIAELVAINQLPIRLILVSGTQAPEELLLDLFDVFRPDKNVLELVQLLEKSEWVHAFERRSVTIDTAIQSVLRAAVCFWLSGGRHPESFATLVDYQQAIANEAKNFKVLILASDPSDASRLHLIKEFSEIEAEASRQAKFRLVTKYVFSSRPDELARRLLEERPHIVHFSGHGDSMGRLCFEDVGGRVWPADKSAIAAMFEPCRRYTKCVLLNACYSAEQARLISQHVEYTAGLSAAVPDSAAIALAKGFYGSLAVTGKVSAALQSAGTNLNLVAGNSVELKVTYRSADYGSSVQ